MLFSRQIKNLRIPVASICSFESLIYSYAPCSLQLSLVCNKHCVKNSMQQCAEVVHPFVLNTSDDNFLKEQPNCWCCCVAVAL
jgi:hypothetical protein